MPKPDNYFKTLAGVSVHYDRYTDPAFGYGTRGKSYPFYCLKSLQNKLRDFFQELWSVCPLGEAEVITSAGAYVDKPGAHGLGRGFDIDGIFWHSRDFVTLNYPSDRRFYLGVESILRKHFGTVLNYEYNAAHRDHWHVDDMSAIGFYPTHRSRVLYLQMALTYVFDSPVAIDGKVGPETNGAARALLQQEDLAGAGAVDSDPELHAALNDIWPDLLDTAASAAFEKLPVVEKTPLELLEDVYTILTVEFAGDERRKRIETSLTTFTTHDETADWLAEYRS